MLKYFFSLIFFILCFENVSAQKHIPYRKGNLWGIADSLGNLVIECKYDEVDLRGGYLFVLKTGKKVEMMTQNLVSIKNIPQKDKWETSDYGSFDDFYSPFYFFTAGGVLFKSNHKIIEGVHYVIDFDKKYCVVIFPNGKIDLLNAVNGEIVTPYNIRNYIEGDKFVYLVYEDKGKFKITDKKTFDITLPLKLENEDSILNVSCFENSFWLKRKGKYALYDFKQKKFLTKFIFTHVDKVYSNNYTLANIENQTFIIDSNGEISKPLPEGFGLDRSGIWKYGNGLVDDDLLSLHKITMSKTDTTSEQKLFNKKGEMLIPDYNVDWLYANELICLEKNGKQKFISQNEKFKIFVENSFEGYLYYKDKRNLMVKYSSRFEDCNNLYDFSQKKWLFEDNRYNIEANFNFNYLIITQLADGKQGVYSLKEKKIVIPCQYGRIALITDQSNGLFMVWEYKGRAELPIIDNFEDYYYVDYEAIDNKVTLCSPDFKIINVKNEVKTNHSIYVSRAERQDASFLCYKFSKNGYFYCTLPENNFIMSADGKIVAENTSSNHYVFHQSEKFPFVRIYEGNKFLGFQNVLTKKNFFEN